jgi:hypothetical protein
MSHNLNDAVAVVGIDIGKNSFSGGKRSSVGAGFSAVGSGCLICGPRSRVLYIVGT